MKRLWRAFFYSLDGLKASWKSEAAFRQEVLLAIILIPTAFVVTSDSLERALLIAVLFLVMIVELLNTGIETVVDHISEEKHPLAKKAKDCGAAAVLLSLVLAAIVWGGVLL